MSDADKTDWAKVDALTDEEIAASVAGDPDAPPIVDEEWFRGATIVYPDGHRQPPDARLPTKKGV